MSHGSSDCSSVLRMPGWAVASPHGSCLPRVLRCPEHIASMLREEGFTDGLPAHTLKSTRSERRHLVRQVLLPWAGYEQPARLYGDRAAAGEVGEESSNARDPAVGPLAHPPGETTERVPGATRVRRWLKVFRRSTYRPDRNDIERLWRYLKQTGVANHLLRSVEEFKARLLNLLATVNKDPTRITAITFKVSKRVHNKAANA